jgi:hypothetical protein
MSCKLPPFFVSLCNDKGKLSVFPKSLSPIILMVIPRIGPVRGNVIVVERQTEVPFSSADPTSQFEVSDLSERFDNDS